ncbi:phosphoglycerate dehydrogenase [Natrialba sp. INN-245]|uniref:phosphoglycerate dehydrogenase n=1 Tax=Natrialba sp. INN-245 TaxID=2690967 RepID=UPI00130FD56A|nr:phosphoglycerate dehydrogenase [Natrialba sp. INN-245]MWV41765.1 phosphoglycerate dehydrogenase [Natrialba sp. INN-245]
MQSDQPAGGENPTVTDQFAGSQEQPQVLICDPIAEAGLEQLRESCAVTVRTDASSDELHQVIDQYDAMVVRSGTDVSASLIDAARNLKIVGRAGVGVDNIDIEAATDAGVIVANAPEANTVAAAEHALTLLLASARNVSQADSDLSEGDWNKSEYVGTEIRGKTLGVVGFGRIGSEVARRANALGMDIVAYDPFVGPEPVESVGGELCSFDDVVERADFITVHTPHTDETHHLLGASEFEAMKETTHVVNASRGGVIDEDALAAAVESGEIGGAAIDVFEREPPDPDNPLVQSDDVLTTPHLGASTTEAQRGVATTIADQVLAVLNGEMASTALNAPSLESEHIRPYVDLSEKLGQVLTQIVDERVEELEIAYSGEVADADTEPITRAVQTGYLSPILGRQVNIVNASRLMEKRNVQVVEQSTNVDYDFTSLIKITGRTGNGDEQVVAGTVFGESTPTLVRIGQHRVDVPLESHMLLFKGSDEPGVIGHVGSILSQHSINIAGMYNSRETIGGQAIMVIVIDTEPTPETYEDLLDIDEIHAVDEVQL